MQRPHPEYYKNTVLKETRAPDHGNLDILAEVIPAAKKRNMKVICWLEDVFRADLPNIEKLQERDLHGRNAETLCVNNPNYRNFLTGLVEDYARSYDIDGLMWGSERQGAMCDSIGATHDTPPVDPGQVTCFCEFCQAKAKQRGINPERAKEGFLALETYVRACRSGKRPVDGYYPQFWRLLLRYPELAAWEMLWTDSLRETYAAIYETVKTAKPSIPRRLAHLAQQFFQSDLSRGTGPARAIGAFRFHQSGDVQQLWRRAHGAVCRQHRLDDLWRSFEAGGHRHELRA